MTPLPTGAGIGILGGGQLGRMLACAAATLGFDVHILCPEEDCPAARVAASHICADYDDLNAVLSWANRCDVITYEFENVPVKTIKHLIDNGICVRPGSKALEYSQDRLTEKNFLRASGIPTGDFAEIATASDIPEALDIFGGKGILKTRREGYDGKGQVRIEAGDDYQAAHKAIGHQPAILEAMIPFSCEISTILARGSDGQICCYDVPRNEHVNGILRRSIVPNGLSLTVSKAACDFAEKLAKALDFIGVLALEFFVLEDGSLVANEFAPRVHNSGHWTPEACETGQFEQHIRAISGWPLGPVTRHHDVEMHNLLGTESLDPPGRITGEDKLTLYGKHDPKAGRKMGHFVRRFSLTK